MFFLPSIPETHVWEEQQNVCWWQQLSFSSSGEGVPFLCQPSYKTLGLDSGSRCGLKCLQDLDDKQLFMFMLEVNGRGSAVWIFIKQALEGALCTSLLCAQIISVGILWSQVTGTESYLPFFTSALQHFLFSYTNRNQYLKDYFLAVSTIPFASFEAVHRKPIRSTFANWSVEGKKIACLFDFLILRRRDKLINWQWGFRFIPLAIRAGIAEHLTIFDMSRRLGFVAYCVFSLQARLLLYLF